MLIIGAKGFAKEVLEVFHQLGKTDNIVFYDDVNNDIGELLFDKYTILKNESQVIDYFKSNGNQFTIGIGNPKLRYKLYKKFINLGGEYVSTISPLALMGNYEINIGNGSNILMNAVFSNSITIGIGCIIYYNVVLTHDCVLGDFVEVSPSSILLGRCKIGSFTHISANVTILPNVTIGKNVIIGAGSVVTKDIPDNVVAFGSPSKVIRKLDPLTEENL
jgi:sugar O-acyltransferase (sialic acid O-acetyltransferase NeuD family)